MNSFQADPFGPSSTEPVSIDVYTTAYRVSGVVQTRFVRVADILNQLAGDHLLVEQATVSEFDGPTATIGAQQVMVARDEILFAIVGASAAPVSRPEMRIPKRAVRGQLALPPFRVIGSVHVPHGSRPADGLLNSVERFMAMTDVSVSCSAHPELARSAEAIAIQRRLAHLILVADDERPDELLADVLDESTAQGWLREPGSTG
jgi:hypothetical protein